jgi:hypothetical protein
VLHLVTDVDFDFDGVADDMTSLLIDPVHTVFGSFHTWLYVIFLFPIAYLRFHSFT